MTLSLFHEKWYSGAANETCYVMSFFETKHLTLFAITAPKYYELNKNWDTIFYTLFLLILVIFFACYQCLFLQQLSSVLGKFIYRMKMLSFYFVLTYVITRKLKGLQDRHAKINQL